MTTPTLLVDNFPGAAGPISAHPADTGHAWPGADATVVLDGAGFVCTNTRLGTGGSPTMQVASSDVVIPQAHTSIEAVFKINSFTLNTSTFYSNVFQFNLWNWYGYIVSVTNRIGGTVGPWLSISASTSGGGLTSSSDILLTFGSTFTVKFDVVVGSHTDIYYNGTLAATHPSPPTVSGASTAFRLGLQFPDDGGLSPNIPSFLRMDSVKVDNFYVPPEPPEPPPPGIWLRDDFTGSGQVAGRTPDGVNSGPWENEDYWSNGDPAEGGVSGGYMVSVNGVDFAAHAPLALDPVDAYLETRVVSTDDFGWLILTLRHINDTGEGVSLHVYRNGDGTVVVDFSAHSTPAHTPNESVNFSPANVGDFILRMEVEDDALRVFIDDVLVVEQYLTDDEVPNVGGGAAVEFDETFLKLDYIEVGSIGYEPPSNHVAFWTSFVASHEIGISAEPPVLRDGSTKDRAIVLVPDGPAFEDYTVSHTMDGTPIWFMATILAENAGFYVFTTNTSPDPSAYDTYLAVFDAAGNVLAQNDDIDTAGNDYRSYIATSVSAGDCYIVMSTYEGGASSPFQVTPGDSPVPAGAVLSVHPL